MIDERFVILASIIILLGDTKYLVETVKGKVKPNKISWLMFSLAPIIAFAAQLSQGVGLASITTLAFGCVPLLIFFASFVNKKSYWKIHNFEIFCGVLSFAGLLLWYTTRVGNVAIVFSILADLFATLPIIIKSIHRPETESYSVFLGSAIGGSITLLTIKSWDFAHVGFPLYIVIVCILLVVLIKFKLGKVLVKRGLL